VYGIDYSSQSVAVATKINREWIKIGRVEIREASVSRLPFPDNTFDLVTAVETHFWWPDLPSDIREVLRVIKPGGRLVIVAEVYKGASSLISKLAEKASAVSGMALLSADEHKELLAAAGYTDVQIATDSGKGWMRHRQETVRFFANYQLLVLNTASQKSDTAAWIFSKPTCDAIFSSFERVSFLTGTIGSR
jgi:SAM-dependent methyltransferase